MRDLEFGIKANDRTGPAFESAEARAKRFNGELDKTNAAYAMAGTAAKAFAAAFSIAAIAGFGRMVRGVIDDAADLVDLADKVGISVEDVQRLQYGFKLAGIEAGEVDGILSQWSRRIGEAYTSGGKLADVLKANNVPLTDSAGHLRSLVDLMRDYSDLMSRAGSNSQQQVLSALAFGKANDEMINAIGGGKEKFDEMRGAIDAAGGALETEIMRKAADISDTFDRMWKSFSTEADRAILHASAMLYDLRANMQPGLDRMLAAQIAAEKGDQVLGSGAWFGARATDPILTENGGRFPVNDRFGGDATAQNDALVKMLRDRFAPKTIIPDDSPARTASTAAATEQVDAYQKVIDKLREEQSTLGMNATEQKIVNEQRAAGVTAISAEGIAIAKLVTDIERQTAATKSLHEQTEFLKSSTASFFTTWRHGMQEGEGIAASFFNAVGGFADTLATKMEERFAAGLIDQLMGSLGGSGFSLLTPLFSTASSTGGGAVAAKGSMIAPSNAAKGMNVRIENNGSNKVQVEEEQDEAGGKRLAVIIDEENAASLARPGSRSSRAMRSRFGVKQRLTRR